MFSNRTTVMTTLLKAETIPVTLANFCAIAPVDQLVWGERGDELNKAMLYLMNSKNNNPKKDLHLAYSQGDLTAYPPTIEEMARYLSRQYPDNISANQHNGKEKDRKKGDDLKS